MSHLLGIDIGTSGTKVLVCNQAGRVIATATSPHDLIMPKPGWSEQDPQQWWRATCKAVKAALHKGNIKKNQIVAIGLSGQMHGSVFLANTTKPLRPAILWNDQRTAEQCAQIEQAAGGKRKLIKAVGNPALTGFTAPKILWVKQHQSQIYRKTKQILLPKDYIRYCMTGTFATEVSDASGTLLFNVAKRKWNTTLMRKLDIDSALMPTCYESHEVTSHLSAEGAKAMGLLEGIPVVGGAADNAAAAIGNGVVNSGILCASLGTSGVMFAHSDQPALDPGGRVHTMCSAVDGKWCVFGCMLSAGGSFQWFRNELAEPELAEAKKKKIDPYTLLIQKAQAAPLGSEGLFFLPYLTGERCPHPDPDARGAYIGLTRRHTRNHIIRALLEGVTFGMNDALEIMRHMNIPVKTIRLTGGGAKDPFWRQLQADIYNAPVATVNSDEGPAFGVALLAGVGIGVWKNIQQACKAIITETEKRKPLRKHANQYIPYHKQYQQLYAALAPEFKSITKLS
ncbi:xylulokinase [Poriferisphaera sp. WC338]|uniref:xylulokinase n=1 Tax=Poriferisphaera sp. WC338 TaxID=3425129 RepID=UPI003D817128